MKKFRYYIPIALCLMGLASCNDDLDLLPKDKVDMENSFKTETDLQLFTNYFYQQVIGTGGYFEDQDDCKVNQTLSAVMRAGTNRTVPASGSGWSWSALRRMNTFLEYADRCEDKAAVTKYTAVTRFFRSYFYFKKVQRFGDVPWIDRQLGSADPQLYAPRDSRELIMQKMIEDIDYAIDNLPTKEKEASAPYRVTAGAALALKAQFCLYEGTFRKYHGIDLDGHDWQWYLQQCVDAAEKLMSGKYGSYKLYSTGKPNEDYVTLFGQQDANKDEFILAVKYDQGMQLLHNANAHSIVATQGMPGYTRKFVCTYLMKDGSRFTDIPGWQQMQFVDEMQNRDPRLSQSIRGLGYHRMGQTAVLAPDLQCSTTGYHAIKFVGESQMGSILMDKNNMSSNDLPEFRYAEVLLNFAEAKAELGTITQSDIDKSIKLLRDRVGMANLNLATVNANPDPYLTSPETGYYNVSGANTGIILEVRRERAIELVQEGFRWNDLMRWKCGKMIDQSLQGMYFPGPGSYDLSGDNKPDIILYAEGTSKPAAPNGELVWQIGKDLRLSNGNSGYTDFHSVSDRQGFNEGRDYLYPIPTDEINLNPNLTQNPGWGASSGM
ncbi:MAG: RagB/SusD family nutrient uptake outer membrane protein [Muribaculaceae bacterium]|nr:RagB/SusD family nutrient uptake outer membrane protein [Muribaculaceae bacterium]